MRALLLTACLLPAPADVQTPRRPNLVVLLADDLGWTDLGCTGSRYYETPNLDRLRAQGMLFTDAYSNGPNCSPTRAALLTGRYPPKTGVTNVLANPVHREFALLEPPRAHELAAEELTIAELLRTAGYRTGHFGKWHLGSGELGPIGQGFDVNVGGDEHGHPGSYFHPFRNDEYATPVPGQEGDYLTDVLTDQAIDFVMRSRKRSFFLYLPFFAVHTPLQAKPELIAKFANKKADGRQRNPTYAAMIAALDDNVGRLLKVLDALDLADDTIVVFASDNGGNAVTGMAPLRGRKGMLYEGGIRVPMIVRWPGRVAAGSTCGEPVISLDLFPTFAEAVGARTETGLDGASLLPLLTHTGDWSPRALYWHFPHYLPGRQTPAGAIRRGKWKLIETFETDTVELFDLETDLGETTNLAEQEPEVAAELRAALHDWRQKNAVAMPTRR